MIDEDVVKGLFNTYQDPGICDWLVSWLHASAEKRERIEGRMRDAGNYRLHLIPAGEAYKHSRTVGCMCAPDVDGPVVMHNAVKTIKQGT
ncbi:hypothetical protein [Leifsonia sp. Root227]|uniref:hypothetical protein n=1 Tax=Leifsonia sp. Root227 TaxID=1736496 RepID=UPI0012FC4FB6|nr:hypothetical protein [Leifsonia sp. Root227]